MNKHILVIVGSLRKDSMNKALGNALPSLGVEGLEFEMADISAVPLYNQDLEADMSAVVKDLKEKIASASGIVVLTPEYNRSIPGVLKNVIDWTSRPYGQSAWAGKPVTIAGATGGAVGTAAAQGHLRDVLSVLATHLMAQPEIYIGGYADKFDASGMPNESTKAFLKGWMEKFKAHLEIF